MELTQVLEPQDQSATHCSPRHGEFFCHLCRTFVALADHDAHQREHNAKSRMLYSMQGLAFLLCLLLTSAVVSAQNISDQFPEAPQPVKHSQFGGYEVDKAQLPKRAPIFTKTWVGAHAFYLGAVVADAELTHQGLAHHKCVEGNTDLGRRPSRGDLYRNNMIEFGLLTGMDLLFQAVHQNDHPSKAFAWVPYIGAGYGSTVHLKGALTWPTRCW
jgi:hypothetical protein